MTINALQHTSHLSKKSRSRTRRRSAQASAPRSSPATCMRAALLSIRGRACSTRNTVYSGYSEAHQYMSKGQRRRPQPASSQKLVRSVGTAEARHRSQEITGRSETRRDETRREASSEYITVHVTVPLIHKTCLPVQSYPQVIHLRRAKLVDNTLFAYPGLLYNVVGRSGGKW